MPQLPQPSRKFQSASEAAKLSLELVSDLKTLGKQYADLSAEELRNVVRKFLKLLVFIFVALSFGMIGVFATLAAGIHVLIPELVQDLWIFYASLALASFCICGILYFVISGKFTDIESKPVETLEGGHSSGQYHN